MYRVIKQLDFGLVHHLPKCLRRPTALLYHTDNGVFGHRPRKAMPEKIGMQRFHNLVFRRSRHVSFLRFYVRLKSLCLQHYILSTVHKVNSVISCGSVDSPGYRYMCRGIFWLQALQPHKFCGHFYAIGQINQSQPSAMDCAKGGPRATIHIGPCQQAGYLFFGHAWWLPRIHATQVYKRSRYLGPWLTVWLDMVKATSKN